MCPSPATPSRCTAVATVAIAVSTWLATGCGRPATPTPATIDATTTLPDTAPARLAETGLYRDFAARTLAADVLSFTPQYPLWTDGAAKQRWILLPPGSTIDGSDIDHWQFPIGTRLWKQFSFGRAVETRYMQRRSDGSWLYATYVWTVDGDDAVLAPVRGVVGACESADGKRHDIPGVVDCRLCHEGGRTPVLGFSALQLSSDRDALAPHATTPAAGDVDLDGLLARGLVCNLPAATRLIPPHITARSPIERAALGYLHGNCSSCHNGDGPLQRLGLRFDYPLATHGVAPAIATAVGQPSQFTRGEARTRLAAGDPAHSVLPLRLRATDALTQMPPFGRHLADTTAIELIEQWIRADLTQPAAGDAGLELTKREEQ